MHEQLRYSSFIRAKSLQLQRPADASTSDLQGFDATIECEVLRSQVFLLSDVPHGIEATDLQEERMEEVLRALASHTASSQLNKLCGYWQVTYPVKQAGFGVQSPLRRLRGKLTTEVVCERIDVTHRHIMILPEAQMVCEVLQFDTNCHGECYAVDSGIWRLDGNQMSLQWKSGDSFLRTAGAEPKVPLMPRRSLETAPVERLTVRYVDDALCIVEDRHGRLLPMLANPDFAAGAA